MTLCGLLKLCQNPTYINSQTWQHPIKIAECSTINISSSYPKFGTILPLYNLIFPPSKPVQKHRVQTKNLCWQSR